MKVAVVATTLPAPRWHFHHGQLTWPGVAMVGILYIELARDLSVLFQIHVMKWFDVTPVNLEDFMNQVVDDQFL